MKAKDIAIAAGVFIATAAVVIVLGVLFLGRGGTEKQIREQLELGHRYLSELNYEEAIVAFRKVIELDPKNSEAYVSLADAFAANGQLEEALEVLQGAPEDADDPDRIAEKIEEIRKLLEEQAAAEADQAAANRGEGADGANPGGEDSDGAGDGENAGGSETAGEAQAGPELNEYGAIVFEQRPGYAEFDQMPAEDQEFTEACAQAAIRQDGEALRELMKTKEPRLMGAREPMYRYFTRWNGYKVGIYVNWDVIDDTGMRQYITEQGYRQPENVESSDRSLAVEIRPETGMGYFALVVEHYGLKRGNYSYQTDDMGNILPDTVQYEIGTLQDTQLAECSCEDWQWDGELILKRSTIEEITEEAHPGEIYHYYATDTTTGAMSRGLRSGDFQITGSFKRVGETADGDLPTLADFHLEGQSRSEHYENGVHEFGNAWVGLYRGVTITDDPLTLTDLYW